MNRKSLREQKPGQPLDAKDYGFEKPNKMVKSAPKKKGAGSTKSPGKKKTK